MAMGVSVVVVDGNIEHLLKLSSSLLLFNYQVMTCQTGAGALSLLRNSGAHFHILLADVALPDMDGFELLAAVRSSEAEEFKSLQVVLFSSSDAVYDAASVRALNQGACAFYTKPTPMEVLQHLWQHAFRRKIQSFPPPSSIGPLQKKRRRDGDFQRRATFKNGGPKKPRLHWSPELCSKFVAAVEVIGIDNLTVRKIISTMDGMGVVGLTEAQVSSHLQQYRKRLAFNKKSSSSAEEESSKQTSSAAPQKQTTTSSVDSYLSLQQLPSTDYTTTTSQQSSQTRSYGGGVVVESEEAENLDWCLNLLDLSFLQDSEPEIITNLLASN